MPATRSEASQRPRQSGRCGGGCEAAYHLVHSLASKDFAKLDRSGAKAFGAAASVAEVRQVIHLGGLGDDDELSAHLSSRREVEGEETEGAPATAPVPR